MIKSTDTILINSAEKIHKLSLQDFSAQNRMNDRISNLMKSVMSLDLKVYPNVRTTTEQNLLEILENQFKQILNKVTTRLIQNQCTQLEYSVSAKFLKKSLAFYLKESTREMEVGEALEEFVFTLFEMELKRSSVDYLTSGMDSDEGDVEGEGSTGSDSQSPPKKRTPKYEIFTVMEESSCEEEDSQEKGGQLIRSALSKRLSKDKRFSEELQNFEKENRNEINQPLKRALFSPEKNEPTSSPDGIDGGGDAENGEDDTKIEGPQAKFEEVAKEGLTENHQNQPKKQDPADEIDIYDSDLILIKADDEDNPKNIQNHQIEPKEKNTNKTTKEDNLEAPETLNPSPTPSKDRITGERAPDNQDSEYSEEKAKNPKNEEFHPKPNQTQNPTTEEASQHPLTTPAQPLSTKNPATSSLDQLVQESKNIQETFKEKMKRLKRKKFKILNDIMSRTSMLCDPINNFQPKNKLSQGSLDRLAISASAGRKSQKSFTFRRMGSPKGESRSQKVLKRSNSGRKGGFSTSVKKSKRMPQKGKGRHIKSLSLPKDLRQRESKLETKKNRKKSKRKNYEKESKKRGLGEQRDTSEPLRTPSRTLKKFLNPRSYTASSQAQKKQKRKKSEKTENMTSSLDLTKTNPQNGAHKALQSKQSMSKKPKNGLKDDKRLNETSSKSLFQKTKKPKESDYKAQILASSSSKNLSRSYIKANRRIKPEKSVSHKKAKMSGPSLILKRLDEVMTAQQRRSYQGSPERSKTALKAKNRGGGSRGVEGARAKPWRIELLKEDTGNDVNTILEKIGRITHYNKIGGEKSGVKSGRSKRAQKEAKNSKKIERALAYHPGGYKSITPVNQNQKKRFFYSSKFASSTETKTKTRFQKAKNKREADSGILKTFKMSNSYSKDDSAKNQFSRQDQVSLDRARLKEDTGASFRSQDSKKKKKRVLSSSIIQKKYLDKNEPKKPQKIERVNIRGLKEPKQVVRRSNKTSKLIKFKYFDNSGQVVSRHMQGSYKPRMGSKGEGARSGVFGRAIYRKNSCNSAKSGQNKSQKKNRKNESFSKKQTSKRVESKPRAHKEIKTNRSCQRSLPKPPKLPQNGSKSEKKEKERKLILEAKIPKNDHKMDLKLQKHVSEPPLSSEKSSIEAKSSTNPPPQNPRKMGSKLSASSCVDIEYIKRVKKNLKMIKTLKTLESQTKGLLYHQKSKSKEASSAQLLEEIYRSRIAHSGKNDLNSDHSGLNTLDMEEDSSLGTSKLIPTGGPARAGLPDSARSDGLRSERGVEGASGVGSGKQIFILEELPVGSLGISVKPEDIDLGGERVSLEGFRGSFGVGDGSGGAAGYQSAQKTAQNDQFGVVREGGFSDGFAKFNTKKRLYHGSPGLSRPIKHSKQPSRDQERRRSSKIQKAEKSTLNLVYKGSRRVSRSKSRPLQHPNAHYNRISKQGLINRFEEIKNIDSEEVNFKTNYGSKINPTIKIVTTQTPNRVPGMRPVPGRGKKGLEMAKNLKRKNSAKSRFKGLKSGQEARFGSRGSSLTKKGSQKEFFDPKNAESGKKLNSEFRQFLEPKQRRNNAGHKRRRNMGSDASVGSSKAPKTGSWVREKMSSLSRKLSDNHNLGRTPDPHGRNPGQSGLQEARGYVLKCSDIDFGENRISKPIAFLDHRRSTRTNHTAKTRKQSKRKVSPKTEKRQKGLKLVGQPNSKNQDFGRKNNQNSANLTVRAILKGSSSMQYQVRLPKKRYGVGILKTANFSNKGSSGIYSADSSRLEDASSPARSKLATKSITVAKNPRKSKKRHKQQNSGLNLNLDLSGVKNDNKELSPIKTGKSEAGNMSERAPGHPKGQKEAIKGSEQNKANWRFSHKTKREGTKEKDLKASLTVRPSPDKLRRGLGKSSQYKRMFNMIQGMRRDQSQHLDSSARDSGFGGAGGALNH